LESAAVKFGFDAKAKETASIFTDYSFPFAPSETLSTFLAGAAGLILIFVLYKAASLIVLKFSK